MQVDYTSFHSTFSPLFPVCWFHSSMVRGVSQLWLCVCASASAAQFWYPFWHFHWIQIILLKMTQMNHTQWHLQNHIYFLFLLNFAAFPLIGIFKITIKHYFTVSVTSGIDDRSATTAECMRAFSLSWFSPCSHVLSSVFNLKSCFNQLWLRFKQGGLIETSDMAPG